MVLLPRFSAAIVATLAIFGVPTQSEAQVDLPADEAGAVARLDASPRHGEWVKYHAGSGDSVTAWVVYPERPDPAPVVIVIHEIYGLTDWVRGVADLLAAEGFIAVTPDLLSGTGPDGGGSESVDRQGAVRLIRDLDKGQLVRRLEAAAAYGTALPAAMDRVGSIGFCWGGRRSFDFATTFPDLTAAVVYYGTSPGPEALARVNARVLGNYGGDDARVNADIAPTRQTMSSFGKSYEAVIYDGAGHGFLRAQQDRDGANLRAAEQAWPRTVAFLREALEE